MRTVILLAALGLSGTVCSSPLRVRDIPTPVDGETARQFLSELVVAVDSNDPPYSRSLFKTWDLISGNCDTRETVLIRDGTNVVTNKACASVSGNWVSPYDGVPTTLASDLDIDHLVPLKEAWLSGARDWTPAQREAFANDLVRPQLVAITDNLNDSKDVAHFLPPLASYVCTYVRAWVTVKHFYNLTMDTAEQAALTTQLANC
ncbi:putative secreted protein [Psilocybe cubensis]|uniref:Secreted protein n=1 Tax=Psilocybe cubensis TaxID=181762 RepID=A0ACB8GKA5_PSICU|nr:putative secreted protein [Psilocybe cubensis]KAH9475475.1 putative secreted protein [Psilocybe cubensis]